ncbi:MAG: hypothetical protein Q4D23_11690, partial [Bacteroidales bacterium]|nr:hypothetical protein [Bacteroidales bacterium]
MATTVKALPGVPATSRLPYLGAQILSALGTSETNLSERAVKRIKKSMPVPVEQEILWADVVFGTRTHGVVFTDQGLFLKDGPSGDEDDNEDWSESEGAGYHYLRWRNFDPSVLSVEKRKPSIGGILFSDAERFETVAKECGRIIRDRNRSLQLGSAALRDEGLSAGPAVTNVYRKTAAETYKACLAVMRNHSDRLPLIEVPSTQYDAVLQRIKKAISAGKVEDLDNPDLAGAILRQGGFTFRQAMNLAEIRAIPGVSFDSFDEVVTCGYSFSLTQVLYSWLAKRSGVRGLDPELAHGPKGVAQEAFEAAGGIPVEPPKNQQEAFMGMAANTAMMTAGRSVGAAGARALVTALGVASGPVAAIASFALGNMVSDAVPEAFSMA